MSEAYPMKVEVVVHDKEELRSLYGFMAGNAPRPALASLPVELQTADPAPTEEAPKATRTRRPKAEKVEAPATAEPAADVETDLGDGPADESFLSYTDSQLSQLAAAAVQKLGSPDAVRNVIKDYVPAGEVAHTRNIPHKDRAAFVAFIEGLDKKAPAASTDDF